MAIVNPIAVRDKTFGNNVVLNKWLTIISTSSFGAVINPGWSDRSIQVSGTWNGATITVLGSNSATLDDGSDGTWFTLNDPAGAPLAFTVDGLRQITENCKAIKLAIAGAGGSTSLNAYLVTRQNG